MYPDNKFNRFYDFETSIANNNMALFKKLYSDPELNPALYNNVAIKIAAKHGCLEILKILLKDFRTDPSKVFALTEAANNGHLDVVRLLLKDRRVNPIKERNTHISKAAQNGHLDVVEL